MDAALTVLLVDARAGDRMLAALTLARQLPQAVVTEVGDALALAEALAGAPDVAVVAADLTWASVADLVATIRRRSPQTAVVLFGRRSDILSRVVDPGTACDGVVRKSSAGFLALGSIIISAVGRAGAAHARGSGTDDSEAAAGGALAAEGHDPGQEKREMALLFSHDLREPVQQLVRLARQGQSATDLPSAGRVLGHVLDRAERLNTMLDGLTDYLVVGGRRAAASAIDLKDCLDRAVENLRSSVADSHAEIRIAGTRLPALGDEQQLVHLFQNLIANAIKFCNGARPVITVTAERCGDRWLMKFRDNGIGIPPASLERIFDLGARVHAASDYPGAGIGLALCRRIVERHNGRIWAESTPGEGSTFLVLLPSAVTTGRASPRSAAEHL